MRVSLFSDLQHSKKTAGRTVETRTILDFYKQCHRYCWTGSLMGWELVRTEATFK